MYTTINMKRILIFSTFDNFYLKDLLLKMSKNSKFKFKYILINEYVNLKSIFMRLFTLGIFNSVKFLVLNVYKVLLRDNLVNNLNQKNVLNLKGEEKIIQYIKKNKIDLIMSVNYPKKISYKIIKAAKYGGVNCHFGKLPKYSGKYPIIRALMNKEDHIYTTTHFMDDKFDTAKIIKEKKLKILNQDIIQLYSQIHQLSLVLIMQTLEAVFKKKANKKIINKRGKTVHKNLKLLQVLKFKYFGLN